MAEAMDHIYSDEVPLEHRPCDTEDDKFVVGFLRQGCSCTKWGGFSCSNQFIRFRELISKELDLGIMGELFACCNVSTRTSSAITCQEAATPMVVFLFAKRRSFFSTRSASSD